MKTLFVKDRGKWHEWLEANHEQATEVWLVHYKKETGHPQIAYEDAVEEAICFGWIDGKIRKLDETRYARLFTPRKPKSMWSRINIERARKMVQEGRMTAAGSEVFDPGNQTPALPTKLPSSSGSAVPQARSRLGDLQAFPALLSAHDDRLGRERQTGSDSTSPPRAAHH